MAPGCHVCRLMRSLCQVPASTAATQRAPQAQRLTVAGREDTQSTLPSPPPHMQLPSLTGRLESTLRGEAKALPLLRHGCQMWWARMAGNRKTGSWPLLGDSASSDSKKAQTQLQWHFHPQVYFTLDTAQICQSWQTWQVQIQMLTVSLGFLHMPQPWLIFCHYKMTETTWQAQSKQAISPPWCIHL